MRPGLTTEGMRARQREYYQLRRRREPKCAGCGKRGAALCRDCELVELAMRIPVRVPLQSPLTARSAECRAEWVALQRM